jgi:hypothetical protein
MGKKNNLDPPKQSEACVVMDKLEEEPLQLSVIHK